MYARLDGARTHFNSTLFFGSIAGGTIRFNAIQLAGRSYADADTGYLQLFTNDVDFVVTDKWDRGATAVRVLTVTHLLVLPVLLAVAWFSMPSVERPKR